MDWTWFAISYVSGVFFGAIAVTPFFWMLSGLRQRERDVAAYARGYEAGWERADSRRIQWALSPSDLQAILGRPCWTKTTESEASGD